jgi:hypothetical protein
MRLRLLALCWIFIYGLGCGELQSADREDLGGLVRPHVVVLILNAATSEKEVFSLNLGDGEKVDRGKCRFAPGRVTNVAGFLYGKHPLQCGVVSDFDWRRKPVMAESIAAKYQKAGYCTVYWGEWGLGNVSIYHPKERGFDWANMASIGGALTDSCPTSSEGVDDWREQVKKCFHAEKPVFCMLRQGGELTESGMREMLTDVQSMQKDRPALFLVIQQKKSGGLRGHFEAGEWQMTQVGKISQYEKVLHAMKVSRNIWEVSQALEVLLGAESVTPPVYEIYHQMHWSLDEPVEKFRYRGAMIQRDGYVLIDGLQLYRADEQGGIHWEKPLDLAKNAQVHQELLMAYGTWWSKVYSAVRNPRSFPVGERDYEKLELTALDWRASKIILKNGGSPSSKPPVSLAVLRDQMLALKNNEEYREGFPSYSGSWSVRIKRPGRYKIKASLLPTRASEKPVYHLRKGTAHVRLGKREAQLRLMEGSSVITVLMDADAGVQDLECWFTGQLALERVLGAFFVSIERVGEKKLDLQLKPKVKSSDNH